MILPPPALRMAGTTALQQFQIPLTLTAIAASQSASAMVSKRPPRNAIEGGIVDQRVDMSECPGCRGRHSHGGDGIPDVERDSDRFCALCFNQAERGRAVIVIGSDDVCPCRRQAS